MHLIATSVSQFSLAITTGTKYSLHNFHPAGWSVQRLGHPQHFVVMLVTLYQAFIMAPQTGSDPKIYYSNMKNPLIGANGALFKAQALIGDVFLV
jgi:hypothetical protein